MEAVQIARARSLARQKTNAHLGVQPKQECKATGHHDCSSGPFAKMPKAASDNRKIEAKHEEQARNQLCALKRSVDHRRIAAGRDVQQRVKGGTRTGDDVRPPVEKESGRHQGSAFEHL